MSYPTHFPSDLGLSEHNQMTQTELISRLDGLKDYHIKGSIARQALMDIIWDLKKRANLQMLARSKLKDLDLILLQSSRIIQEHLDDTMDEEMPTVVETVHNVYQFAHA